MRLSLLYQKQRNPHCAQNKIQNREEITLGGEERKFATIVVKETESQLDLTKVMDNAYINNIKDTNTLRVSFLKSVYFFHI